MIKTRAAGVFFAGMAALATLIVSMEVEGAESANPKIIKEVQSAPKMKPPVAPLRVDIAMIDISVNQSDCKLWVGWRNTGNTKIDASLVETISVDGSHLATSTNHVVLEPGAYWNHGAKPTPGYIVQGSKSVTAKIDATNVLNESNETNNSMTKTVTCS